MPTRLQLAVFLAICAIVWTVLLGLQGSWSLAILNSTLGVVGPLMLLFLLFDTWLWRFKWLHPWLVPNINIDGTWKGELVSNFRGEDGATIPPIEVFLVVRQGFFGISLRLLTRESESESLTAQITHASDGPQTVIGAYRNTPIIAHRDRSQIHYGALRLAIRGGNPATRLEGEYWTDRRTQGSLSFSQRARTHHDDFLAASSEAWEAA